MTSNTSRGFTLLEVTVAIAIFGILSLALYTVFSQSNRAVNSVVQTIDADEALFIFYNQIDKDFSATCIPLIAHHDHAQNKEDKKVKDGEKKEAKPTLEKLFWAKTINGGQLDSLTFITTNSLSDYNQTHSKLTRVIYKLREQLTSPNSFVLSRQEIYDISLKNFSEAKAQSYDILDALKSLKISFISEKPKDKEQEKNQEKRSDKVQKSPKAVKEFVTATSWSSDESVSKNDLFLPGYVRIEGERWDTKYNKSTEFAFEFKIIAYGYADSVSSAEKDQEKIVPEKNNKKVQNVPPKKLASIQIKKVPEGIVVMLPDKQELIA